MTPNNQTRAAAAADEICSCIEDIGCNHREEAVAEIIARHFDESALRAEVKRYEAAIRWALGEGGLFLPRNDGQGQYWWRTELRRRAALSAEPSEGQNNL